MLLLLFFRPVSFPYTFQALLNQLYILLADGRVLFSFHIVSETYSSFSKRVLAS